MSPETARRIRENVHLLSKKDFYNFLGVIPYIDLPEVINLLLNFGVTDPFNNHYPTLEELYRDVANYQFPIEGTCFITTDKSILPLNVDFIGDIVGGYIKNLFHSASDTTRILAATILAMWDELDTWNDINDYWINKINELFYEADTWNIELVKDKSTGDVSLIILPKSEVKIIDDDGECVIWCEGLHFIWDSVALSEVKIKFNRFEAE